MISSIRGLMSTPNWPSAKADGKAQDAQQYQTAFAPIASAEEIEAGEGVGDRKASGLDWVKRTAEANIEKARQFILESKAQPANKPSETAAEYKTAFSAYFDD